MPFDGSRTAHTLTFTYFVDSKKLKEELNTDPVKERFKVLDTNHSYQLPCDTYVPLSFFKILKRTEGPRTASVVSTSVTYTN